MQAHPPLRRPWLLAVIGSLVVLAVAVNWPRDPQAVAAVRLDEADLRALGDGQGDEVRLLRHIGAQIAAAEHGGWRALDAAPRAIIASHTFESQLAIQSLAAYLAAADRHHDLPTLAELREAYRMLDLPTVVHHLDAIAGSPLAGETPHLRATQGATDLEAALAAGRRARLALARKQPGRFD